MSVILASVASLKPSGFKELTGKVASAVKEDLNVEEFTSFCTSLSSSPDFADTLFAILALVSGVNLLAGTWPSEKFAPLMVESVLF